MDPHATLAAMLEAIAAREMDDAHDHFANLQTWTDAGGFLPLDAIRDAIDAINRNRPVES